MERSRIKAGHSKWVLAPTRILAAGVIAIAALFATGLVTEADAQSNSTIVVRARGTAGGETISLRVDNANVASWTLTTSYQNYTASTSLTGGITVAFTNDASGRDVQVDYIVVNGETRQSENQSYNTGVYANGSCGGGSNSEWMHCNGAIGYGPVANSANSIVVRARGTAGGESITLGVDNTNLATWTLTTSFQDYTASTTLTGAITVAFTNDASGRDVQVDYIVVNGQTRQAEAQSQNTAVYANGSCGGGSFSEWMHCNGVIGFGNVNGGGTGPLPAFFVGNITTNGAVRSDFIRYWDQITPENEGKWGTVEATRDVYNWSGLDRAYNYAIANNIPFKHHTFIWGNQAPSWINSLSASEQAAEIEEWIRDYCARYPKTALIDVVNEATPGHAPAGFAQNAFGSNWIIRSFQLARQYCPNAVLILNDYNVLSWDTDRFIQMATPAVNAGVVDALGAQGHGLEGQSLSSIQSKLNQVAALGLPIYITEYDVARTNDQEQLQIMQTQFPLFRNHPSVAGITLWGYVVGSTWVNGSGLINSNGTQRPAMTWLMNYLGR
ncbi:endo-1,4-beta-xylanase [Steroidobacter cummioxidans]|uniref:endo-1,4-beta-xylanase n=1 Tax=Steroidobacter cummioxidans TaxID=1803913 RepID=UPI000E3197D4|nr:endo-1,4-beta-xylanase [Steroidobacter cummioxidans]